MTEISIKKLQEEANEFLAEFKIGDRVVFGNAYSGMWAELTGMTGTISAIHNDALWTFSIDLDHPECLSDPSSWNSSADGGLTATIGGGGFYLLSEVEKQHPDIIAQLNRNKGIELRPLCTDHPALTQLKQKLQAFDDAMLKSEQRRRQALDKFVQLRIKYVDNDPDVLVAEQAKKDAGDNRTAYFDLPANQRSKKILDALYKKEHETREIWGKLMTDRQKLALANIVEFAEADAIFKNVSAERAEHDDLITADLKALTQEYIGRKHQNLKSGDQYTNDHGEMVTPMTCLDCQWKFSVKP